MGGKTDEAEVCNANREIIIHDDQLSHIANLNETVMSPDETN